MTNDLARIVRATESSLAMQPSMYATQLELFTSSDEKVLAEFLREERDEKPHYRRHKDWELLVGKPEKYLRPKRYKEEQRREFPRVEKQIRDTLADGGLVEIGVSRDTIAVFGDLPTMAYRMLDMETKLYESIIAYAKQIGDEKEVNPREVIRSSDGRDEVFRRTFQTREQFEWYNNTLTQMVVTALGVSYKMLDSFEPRIRELQNTPIVGWIIKMKIDKVLKPFPPKAVAESFLREDIAYNTQRAERIYGGNSGKPRFIDARMGI